MLTPYSLHLIPLHKMDSLTQITLGAAVGEAVLGKKIGNKAMVWGGIAGTIPDLDVITNFYMHSIEAMAVHRGLSHSLLFTVVAAPAFGWLVHQFYKQKIPNQASYKVSMIGLAILFYTGIFGGLIYASTVSNGTPSWQLILTALVLGWLLIRRLTSFWKNEPRPLTEPPTVTEWSWLFFLGFLTHTLLDSLTPYGTQLLSPFSNARIAFNTISVADPLYTIPFILCLIAASFYHRSHKRRKILNWLGIGISSAYLLFGLMNKIKAQDTFAQLLDERKIEYTDYVVSPTILNTMLWQCVANTPDGYKVGFYSVLDEDLSQIKFAHIEKNHELLQPYHGNRYIQILRWFSKGYYNVERIDENTLRYNDALLAVISGELRGTDKHDFALKFDVVKTASGVDVMPDRTPPSMTSEELQKLWERIKGF